MIGKWNLRHAAACTLALLLAVPPALCAAAPDADVFQAIDRRAAQAVASGEVPSIAFAVVVDGRIVHERAFGLADIERGTRATPRTAYALASVTKPITATALMVLHERGRVDLDAPVVEYLTGLRFGGPAFATRPVTLLQLLSHTSGLGTYARIHYGVHIADRPAFADEFGRWGVLVNAPGRVSEYSNLGYGVVDQVIAARSGRGFAAFVDAAVFRPLGMHDSFIGAQRSGERAVATGYDAQLARLPPLRNNTPGAGNAYASVHDLARFARLHATASDAAPALLTRTSLDRMQTQAQPGAFHHMYGDAFYGLGWYVRPERGMVWHEGGMPGASSIIKLLPAHAIAAVALTNRSEANGLMQEFADLLLAAVQPGYAAAPLDPVASYVPYGGQAAFAGTWTGSVFVDGDALPCTLVLGADGSARIRIGGGDARAPLQAELRARVHGDSLISAFGGDGEQVKAYLFPNARTGDPDVDAATAPLLLPKLVRSGDRLHGALVAYASPQRLDYLLPFAIVLERVRPGAPVQHPGDVPP